MKIVSAILSCKLILLSLHVDWRNHNPNSSVEATYPRLLSMHLTSFRQSRYLEVYLYL